MKKESLQRLATGGYGDRWLRATCSHPLPSGGQRRELTYHRLATGGYGDRWLRRQVATATGGYVPLVAIRCQAVDNGAS